MCSYRPVEPYRYRHPLVSVTRTNAELFLDNQGSVKAACGHSAASYPMTSHGFLIFWTERSERNCARAKCSEDGFASFSLPALENQDGQHRVNGGYLPIIHQCMCQFQVLGSSRRRKTKHLWEALSYWVGCSLGCAQATAFAVANSLHLATYHRRSLSAAIIT